MKRNIAGMFRTGHAFKNALNTTRPESVKKHDIGNRIRLLRGRESRPSFAKRFDISVATLARYEADETAPNAVFIMNLCEKYGIETDWLLYGKEAEGPEQGASGNPASSELQMNAPPNIKNETIGSNLLAIIRALDFNDFDRLWEQFRLENDAIRGWLQIELIKRFPEFVEWLESRPPPLRRPPPATLKEEEPSSSYGLPPAFPED